MHDSQFGERFSKGIGETSGMGIGDENLGCPKLKKNNAVINSVYSFVPAFFFVDGAIGSWSLFAETWMLAMNCTLLFRENGRILKI